MKAFKYAHLAFSLASIPIASLAQDADGCRDVLTYSARNYTVESAELGTAVRVYDNFCQNSQAKSGSSTNIGLEAVIKAVPVKFNLGHGSTSERLDHFCKTFDSDYKNNQASFRSISEVANESTNAWFNCKALAGKGISFQPKISQTQVIIEVARTNAEAARVEGVIYDASLLTCSVPNSATSKGRTTANSQTVKDLSAEYWPITCVRQPQKQTNETVYPKVDLSVSTTKGAFLLPVQADAKYPYQWSSDLQRHMDSLSDAVSLQSVELKATGGAIAGMKDALRTGGVVLPPPPGSPMNAEETCPAGTYMVGIRHRLDSGGPHGITSWLEPKCAPLRVE